MGDLKSSVATREVWITHNSRGGEVRVQDRIRAESVGLKLATRPRKERCHLAALLCMAREEVPPEAHVDGQLFTHLPVILDESTNFQVPPVPEVIGQLRRLVGDEAGVYTGNHAVRGIGREEELVLEVIRRPRNVEFAVLDVPPEVRSHLDAVLAPLEGHHVAVRVDVLVEK